MPQFIKWTAILGIKKIRPLYYVDYVKKDAMALLTQELGWEWYGGHHLENRFTAFWHTFFLPERYGIDSRLLGYSALVRSGQISRSSGLEMLSKPQEYDKELIEMVKKRLGFSNEEFQNIICLPRRTYRDFNTYKIFFERTRFFWWLMYRLGRVPKTFYMKFCFPDTH
jgi:hypothetical protein